MARGVVILNAGRSRRMGRPKAELPFDRYGDPTYTFLSRAIDLALSQLPDGPIIVVGRFTGPLPAPYRRAAFIENPHPERGMFSSVQIGLRTLSEPAGPLDATMLLLVDHPLVRRDTIATLWAAAELLPGAWSAPIYQGRLGHPVVLPAAVVDDVLDSPVDSRLDDLLRDRTAVHPGVSDPGVIRNINTPERYEWFFGPLPR